MVCRPPECADEISQGFETGGAPPTSATHSYYVFLPCQVPAMRFLKPGFPFLQNAVCGAPGAS